MSTIVTIGASDLITNSRADINTNFANLNAGKIETSVLDTDTALTANSDANIASQKAIKAYVDAQTLVKMTFETGTGTTYNLTTTAGQKVIVLVKGDAHIASLDTTLTLTYNSVTKDTVHSSSGSVGGGVPVPFTMMYTETPGAATQQLAVGGGVSMANVVWIIMKL